MALCKLNASFFASNITMLDAKKKRRDFCARQGTAKQRPGSVLAYAEDTLRSRDAVWRKKTKFFRRV